MQKLNSRMSALVESSIYRPFISAVTEIGLPNFSLHELMQQLTPHLVSAESTIPDSERVLARFAKSILHGEVIAAETLDAGVFVFFVRGGVGRTGMNVRMTCRDHAWHVEAVHSSHSRPLLYARWLNRSVFGAAVLVAAAVGYAVHTPSQTTAPEPQNVLVSPGQSNQAGSANQVAPAHSTTNGISPGQSTPTSTSQPSPQNPAKTVTYHLGTGVPLYHLAQFLYSQHLVGSAMNFDMKMKNTGVDRSVKPGTYVFPRGDSTSQFISVLRKGPTK